MKIVYFCRNFLGFHTTQRILQDPMSQDTPLSGCRQVIQLTVPSESPLRSSHHQTLLPLVKVLLQHINNQQCLLVHQYLSLQCIRSSHPDHTHYLCPTESCGVGCQVSNIDIELQSTTFPHVSVYFCLYTF